MIEVRDLRVDYDDVCAVRDLSLDVPTGDIYGLVGPNGAGKTTLLRALVGLKDSTYGDIFLNGVDLATHREEAVAVVGFMPDSAPIYPDITVWEYLDLFAASYLVPVADRSRVIEKYLDLVDLVEKREAMTAGLSRGMRQRLLLAKALLPDPMILLLDEPTSGVDPYGRALLKDILRRLGGEGKAVVISSHILSDLSEFCTSIGIMEKGSLVVSGRVEEVSAQVLGQIEVRAEVISGAEECAALLAGDPRVRQVRREGEFCSFTFSGGREELSDLLAALISQGVRLASFGRKKGDLEEIFLKVGAREVS